MKNIVVTVFIFTFVLTAQAEKKVSLLEEARSYFGTGQSKKIQGQKDPDVKLGQKLFAKKIISKQITCTQCHRPKHYGTSLVSFNESPIAHSERNTPTIYNLKGQKYFMWDGKYKELTKAIKNHLQDPLAMGISNPEQIAKNLKDTDIFNKNLDTNEVVRQASDAIGKYLLTLKTRAPIDDYLQGQGDLSDSAKKGLKHFIKYGCVKCHDGINFGGNHLKKLGLKKNYKTSDLGKMKYSHKVNDMHIFKVPTLRNVAKTPPYLHNGSLTTLEEAIDFMGQYQLDKKLTKSEVEEIKDFLGTLSEKDSK